jgi:hypothetical protein
MAYMEDGLYVAVCIDLSLAAQANTLDGAQKKLELQIKDYIQEACEDAAYTEQLLSRKAPFSLILKYHLLSLEIFFSRLIRRKAPSAAKLFQESNSCPA